MTKFQHVRSYQIIFHHMLGLILTRFENQIRPLLAKGCDDLTVGAAINAIIIEPLYMEVSMVDGYINSEVVQGML
ncbi:ABC-three component system protein, partial [Acinetobacter baumannii]|uniref:ABC-three component system protein n=1 Tax=Acinetobacter baumannii TaxID=470 RepID=UPI003CC7A7CD